MTQRGGAAFGDAGNAAARTAPQRPEDGEPLQPGPWPLLAALVFGAALAAGLIGAFVGLSVSSFWSDELFTRWVIGTETPAAFLSRALSDVHPPTYYVVAYAWTHLAGSSDTAIRLLSAVCAVGAIGIFLLAAPFSLAGRLFAGALATSSIYWFYHSQNARSYAFSLLLMALVLWRCAKLIRGDRHDATQLVVTGLLLLIAAMTHLYIFYGCMAALAVVFLLCPQRRLFAIALGAGLLACAAGYYLLVIGEHAQVNTGANWIPAGAGWLLAQTAGAMKDTFGVFGTAALALCATAVLLWAPRPSAGPPGRLRRLLAWLRTENMTVLCLGVPALVLLAGIGGSLVSPNFTTRNFLVVSPFIWGFAARLYDAGTGAAPRRWRPAFLGALCILTLLSATIVGSRGSPHNEPFREAASWIRQHPQCEGAVIPVINMADPAWSDSAHRKETEEAAYAHYLEGYARPWSVFLAELDAGDVPLEVKRELAARIGGEGCPIVAWVSHIAQDVHVPGLTGTLRELTGAAPGAIRMRRFSTRDVDLHRYAVLDRLLGAKPEDRFSGFVFHR